jgi:dTDP-4-dehydrorhamnose reductase
MAHPLILGDGLFGTEIRRQTGWDAISRKNNRFDFTEITTYQEYLSGYDQVLNCIAYTKTYSDEKQKHWDTNFRAVCDLVDFCSETGKKLIQLSTDYIYSYSKENASEEDVPVHCRNWYGYTKLLADGYVQARSQNYLLIRTSFKPKPFPYLEAITTQVGNFDYIDRIASLVIELINAGATGIYNVVTEKKTIYELAKRTAEVIPVDKVLNETMPTNITMNLDKLTTFLKK